MKSTEFEFDFALQFCFVIIIVNILTVLLSLIYAEFEENAFFLYY